MNGTTLLLLDLYQKHSRKRLTLKCTDENGKTVFCGIEEMLRNQYEFVSLKSGETAENIYRILKQEQQPQKTAAERGCRH
ncbi:MAG: hypothetical protein IJ192_01775 [Clostridia bacterium]|nr:hypothetical protein [Clostridia bacterium]